MKERQKGKKRERGKFRFDFPAVIRNMRVKVF